MPEGSDVTKAKDILKYAFKNYKLKKIVKIDPEYKKIKGDLKEFHDTLPSKVIFESLGKICYYNFWSKG
jgi:hypothetical protein